jgi:hypothetical protein
MRVPPNLSVLIGISIIHHPFYGTFPEPRTMTTWREPWLCRWAKTPRRPGRCRHRVLDGETWELKTRVHHGSKGFELIMCKPHNIHFWTTGNRQPGTRHAARGNRQPAPGTDKNSTYCTGKPAKDGLKRGSTMFNQQKRKIPSKIPWFDIIFPLRIAVNCG